MFSIIFSILFVTVFILPSLEHDEAQLIDESDDVVPPFFVEQVVLEVNSLNLTPIEQESYSYYQYDKSTKSMLLVESNPYAEYYHIYLHSIYHNIYQPGAFHFKLPLKTDMIKIEVKWERYAGADNITFPSGYVFDLESRLQIDFGYGSGQGIIIKMEEIEINGVREGHRVYEIDMNEHPVYGMKIDPGFYYLGLNTLSTEFTIKVIAVVSES